MANTNTNVQGTLTITTAKTVSSNNNNVVITAWDLDLQGELEVGDGTAVLTGAHNAQTMGIGATAQDMHMARSFSENLSSLL